MNPKRREFLQQSGLGLATIGASGFVLRADAQSTPSTPGTDAGRTLIQMGLPPKEAIPAKSDLKTIPPLPYGPFYKQGAPFRAKICPPFEPGTAFIMKGRVWALDTKRPLPGAVLDVWHVNQDGKYADGDGDFANRGRLIASETGCYEFESIRPVPYKPNPSNSDFWRCAHFHLLVVSPGYKPLVTEIHFRDDPKQKIDQMFNPALAVSAEKRVVNGHKIEFATFDIVLERAS
jgi:catechol 1,2-dioxygenase